MKEIVGTNSNVGSGTKVVYDHTIECAKPSAITRETPDASNASRSHIIDRGFNVYGSR